MEINVVRGDMRVRLLGVILTAAALTGCTLENQDTPGLSGPSGLSLSMTVTAAPDHLMQDGSSQAVVTVTVKNAQAEPVNGLGINWSVATSDGTQLEPVTQFSVTNAQGQAQTRVTAPPPPSLVPTNPLKLRISAQAQGTDASTSAPGIDRNRMTVEIELVPPAGTPIVNRPPVALFTFSPAAVNIGQSVTFDASNSTDEGQICGSNCTYQWDFGDFTSDTGKITSHRYLTPSTLGGYKVTLTVTDARGGIGSATQTVVVNGPALPVANFTPVPTTPTAGLSAVLDGSSTTFDAGAPIVKYSWVFVAESPTPVETTEPTVVHIFPSASAGGVPVTLTVTDSLGRTSSKTKAIIVQ